MDHTWWHSGNSLCLEIISGSLRGHIAFKNLNTGEPHKRQISYWLCYHLTTYANTFTHEVSLLMVLQFTYQYWSSIRFQSFKFIHKITFSDWKNVSKSIVFYFAETLSSYPMFHLLTSTSSQNLSTNGSSAFSISSQNIGNNGPTIVSTGFFLFKCHVVEIV